MSSRRFVLPTVLVLAIAGGCNGDPSAGDMPGDTAGGGGDSAGDSQGDAGDSNPGDPQTVTSDTGAIFIDACTPLPNPCADNPSADCGKCQYRVFVGPNCSAATPCDDLVLYWTNLGCEAQGAASFFANLAQNDGNLVVACVQPMYPGEMLPFGMGSPERDNMVVAEVYNRIKAGGDLAVWSGANMLTAGCSAGGSRTPVVALRTTSDDTWVGTGTNAACVSDGVVDIFNQDSFNGDGFAASGNPSCASRHGRVVAGYTVATPAPGHSCTASPNGQCACDPGHATRIYNNTCNDGDCLTYDSVLVPDGAGGHVLAAGVSPTNLAIPHWYMITEGSDFTNTYDRCDQDVVPAEPYQALCAAIDADATHTCELHARPAAGHCSTFSSQFATSCLTWFRSL